MIQLPIFSSSSADFQQSIELDNHIFTIRLKFNVRNDSWFMTLSDDNYLIKDIKLVSNYPLFYQYKANFPSLTGDFFVIKLNNNASNEITYDNLGNDYALYYYTLSEYNQWESDNSILR